MERRPSSNSLRCLFCADLPGGGHCRARERVLDVAGRLFREKGFDGIGIDDLMKGSRADARRFYANFKSKEELMANSANERSRELDQGDEQGEARAFESYCGWLSLH